MQHIPVCTDNWHANKSEQFDWHNGVTTAPTPCCITQLPNTIWPFVQPSPICVPGKDQHGGPGVWPCQIQSGLANGPYSYYVDCCLTGGAPKTVTIP